MCHVVRKEKTKSHVHKNKREDQVTCTLEEVTHGRILSTENIQCSMTKGPSGDVDENLMKLKTLSIIMNINHMIKADSFHFVFTMLGGFPYIFMPNFFMITMKQNHKHRACSNTFKFNAH